MTFSEHNYLPDASVAMEKVSQTEPLHIPARADVKWEQLSQQMDQAIRKIVAETQEKYSKVKTVIEDDLIEEWSNLAEGTVHLLNLLLNAESKGQPIQTLVFLDKSARPAAYLVRKTLKYLKEKGAITYSLPPVKFLDVGAKHPNKHTKSLSRTDQLTNELLDRMQLKEPLLVVDEFIDTGDSARRTLNLLQRHQNVKGQAVGEFVTYPDWYHDEVIPGFKDEEVKGVKDVTLVRFQNEALEQISDEAWETLKGLHKKLKYRPRLFSRLYRAAELLTPPLFKVLGKVMVSDSSLAEMGKFQASVIELHRKFENNATLDLTGEELYWFLETGGAATVAPIKGKRGSFLAHREMLDALAQKIAELVTV